MIKELSIFTSHELTAFDRTVKTMYQGYGVNVFSDKNDRWKFHNHYTKHLISANKVANKAIAKMISSNI